MKNLVVIKLVALITLSVISFSGCMQKDSKKSNDQEVANKFLQAIQKSTDLASFNQAVIEPRKLIDEPKKDTSNIAKYGRNFVDEPGTEETRKQKNDVNFRVFFITKKVVTPDFGNITLYEYAKKSGKTYITDPMDFMEFKSLLEKSFWSKNFEDSMALIKQPDFNPTLKDTVNINQKGESFDVLREVFDKIMFRLPLMNGQPPLEMIDLLLEKGASLTTSLHGVQNWEVPLKQINSFAQSLKWDQEQIAHWTEQLEKATDADPSEKAEMKRVIVFHKDDYDNIKNNALKYMADLIALIKKHAQKRGESEVLKGIAAYEKTLKNV